MTFECLAFNVCTFEINALISGPIVRMRRRGASTAANRMSCITASSEMSAAEDSFSNCLRGNPGPVGRPGA